MERTHIHANNAACAHIGRIAWARVSHADMYAKRLIQYNTTHGTHTQTDICRDISANRGWMVRETERERER